MERVLIGDSLADGWQACFRCVKYSSRCEHGLARRRIVSRDWRLCRVDRAEYNAVTQRVIDAGVNLRAIGRAGAGVDNIDMEGSHATGYCGDECAGGNTISPPNMRWRC